MGAEDTAFDNGDNNTGDGTPNRTAATTSTQKSFRTELITGRCLCGSVQYTVEFSQGGAVYVEPSIDVEGKENDDTVSEEETYRDLRGAANTTLPPLYGGLEWAEWKKEGGVARRVLRKPSKEDMHGKFREFRTAYSPQAKEAQKPACRGCQDTFTEIIHPKLISTRVLFHLKSLFGSPSC